MPQQQKQAEQPSDSLYRQDAINASFMQQYGGICMLPKFSHLGLSLTSLLLVVLGFIYISTQPFFETVDLKGWVTTKTPSVDVRSQESAGIVKQLLVSNGSPVTEGQAIAVIARSKGEALGKVGIAAQRALILEEQSNKLAILSQNKQTLALSAQGIDQRYAQTAKQLLEVEKHQQKHRQQLDIAQQRWQSLKNLLSKGLVSVTQLEQSELQMLSLHQQDFELFMRSQNIQSSYNDLTEQQFANKQQTQQITKEINLLNIQTQQQLDILLNDTQIIVTAPASGTIDNLQVDVGRGVAFNQVITQIAPTNRIYFVQLAIPTHQVAFLQKDQQVDIRVDGFAYQKFGSLRGVVSHISQNVIGSQDINGLTANANQALYLINIDIDYLPPISNLNAISLRSGMSISASVNKQQRTILGWLLAPLIDIARPAFVNSEAST